MTTEIVEVSDEDLPEIKREQQRQSNDIYAVINAALSAWRDTEPSQPILTAFISAMACHIADSIAAVPDPEVRNNLIKQVEEHIIKRVRDGVDRSKGN